jgi:hypothetical protein
MTLNQQQQTLGLRVFLGKVSYGIYSYNPIFNFFILFYLKKQKEKF